MFKDNRILILPLEVKIREFLPKLYLAYNILKKTNIKIIIGGTRFLTNKIIYKNCIWFDKNTFPDERSKHPVHKENHLIMQDEEGPISFHTKENKNERYSKEILKQVKHFIYSGREDLEYLDSCYQNKNYSILGMPKFDLIKNNKIFSNEVSKIKKKYKNFIFVTAHDNHFSNDKFYLKKLSKYAKEDKNYQKLSFDKYLKNKLKDSKKIQNNYYALIEIVLKLAKENPNINIIFRRHPSEKDAFIKKKFKDRSKNLKCVYKYSITPWIISCKYYLHSGCQSVLEAAYLEKKIITYMPFRISQSKNFMSFFPFFSNENKILNFFKSENYKKKNFYKKKNLQKIAINLKKNIFFYKGFIKLLNKDYNKLNSYYFYKEKLLIKNYLTPVFVFLSWIKQIIINNSIFRIFIPLAYIVSKNEKMQKFNNLKKNEIVNWLKVFNKVSKYQKPILIKKLSKATFLLYK